MPNYILYTLCLLLTQIPSLLSHLHTASNTRQPQDPTSYGSQEMLPYVSSRFADRNGNEEKDDKDKLLTLFTNTKREVKDAETFLSEMLRVLKHLFAKKQPGDSNKPASKQNDGGQNIAWSYYDDLGK